MSRTLGRHGRLALFGLAVAIALAVAVPLAASGQGAERLYLGMSLHFTGPSTTAGTFVASGAIADAGVADVRDLSLTPVGRTDNARLSGTETYSSDRGTIVTRFEGIAFPLSSPHEVGIGRFEIVSGTGAYAGVSGRGTFEIVVDTSGNQLIGTEIATLQSRSDDSVPEGDS